MIRLVFSFVILLYGTDLPGQTNYYIDSLINQAKSFNKADSLDINRLSIWQKIFNESKSSGSNYRMEEICSSLGDFFYENGLYENAIEYYKHIFSTDINLKNKSPNLIHIYRKIGKSYSLISKPDSAYYYYNQIIEEYNFPERLDLLTDLVDIYAENDNHEKSLTYNLQIKNLLISNQSPDLELSKIYNNIAYNYHRLGQYEKSIEYFHLALEKGSRLSSSEESVIYKNLGISYYNLGNYLKSNELLSQAIKLSIDEKSLADLAHLMATVNLANKNYYQASKQFEQAEELAIKNKMENLLSDIYLGYALLHNITHEYDLAFDYYKKHSKLRDSLKFVEQLNQQRILDNQKYIERTEKENQLLKAKQDFQKLQIEQLKTQASNQILQNEALRADSIRTATELILARQKNEISEANEKNNLLEIARQENLIALKNQQLVIAFANEENAKIENEKKQKEIELAQEKINLQERSAQLKEEQEANERKAIEIEKRKTSQRNTLLFASLLAGLALLLVWAYRNKQKDNKRISKAYDKLEIAQDKIKTAEAKIRSLLRQQVSGAVAEALITENFQTAEEQKFVSIMFLDIRDFTVFCEGRTPAEIIAYQNSVFGFMIDIIEKYHGVVNQLMGDGFMATFGAPISKGNDSLNAYQAAHEILRTLEEKEKQKEIIPTRVGIGLHAGDVVTGNVGNEERKQFSITGNTVILAARLEQLNKKYNSSLVFSKELYDSLPEDERQETEFESVMVKGRSTPIEISVL